MILCDHSEIKDSAPQSTFRPAGYYIAATMSGQAETTPLLRQRKPVADAPNKEEDDTSTSNDALQVDEEPNAAVSWANPFTWPASVYVALLLVSAAAYWSKSFSE